MRVTAIEHTDVYTVSLEECRGHTFVHCDIHTKWSPTVKRSLTKDFCSLRDRMGNTALYTLSDTRDHKHHKFLGLFGFTYQGEVPCDGGLLRSLYKIT